MRKRRHQRGPAVLLASLAASSAFNLGLALPLFSWLEGALVASRDAPPVKVVRVSRAQWSKNLATNPASPGRPRSPADSPVLRSAADEAALPGPKPEEPKKQDPEKIEGTIVDVPPSADDRPNPEAKYLSKYNTHADKETVARRDQLDPSIKRRSNTLERREQSPAKSTLVTPNVSVQGPDNKPPGPEPAGPPGAGKEEKKRQFVLELPDITRRDKVALPLGEGVGLDSHVRNRKASEALRGNSDTYKLQLGLGEDDRDEAASAEAAAGGGGSEARPLPSLSALMPTLGTIARTSGSPEWVDGLPEGDGTFLNAKEFKYATFFYRVRDDVASRWENRLQDETRRRDPTGNIYGTRDRSTLLHVELSREGRLVDVRVERTSGVDFYDQLAVEAFKQAQPFPNPPAGIVEEDGAIRFNFQFTVLRPRSGIDVLQFR